MRVLPAASRLWSPLERVLASAAVLALGSSAAWVLLLGGSVTIACLLGVALFCAALLVTLALPIWRPMKAWVYQNKATPAPLTHIAEDLKQAAFLNQYAPPLALTWGHVPSIHSVVFRHRQNPPWHRETIKLDCGGTVGLDILHPKQADTSTVNTVLVLPGIAGCSDSAYLQNVALAFWHAGWRVVLKNWRGCKTPLTTLRTFSCGSTLDVEIVVRWIKRSFPDSPLYGVGFSMGANVLTRYLGTVNEQQGSDLYKSITASVAISNGYNLNWGYAMVGELFYGAYTRVMLNTVRKPWLMHATQPVEAAEKFDGIALMQAKTLYDFDAAHVPQLYGYASMAEYIAEESSSSHMHAIRTPLITLNAHDDPLFAEPAEAFLKATVDQNPNVVFVMTEWGGHLGWQRSLFWPDDSDSEFMSLFALRCLNRIQAAA